MPTGVIDELSYSRKKDEKVINIILENPTVVIGTVKYNRLYEKLRTSVGKGETEAILLALENNTDFDYVILDDKTARKKALSFGLNIKGTIGILRLFYQKGILTVHPSEVYKKLKSFNFRVKRGIYESILREFFSGSGLEKK